MKIDQMENFLHELWGMKLGEWAKKYYRGIDAYNTSYSGVNADDFLDCWMQFDILGVAMVIARRGPRPYLYNQHPDKLASDGHSELVKELVQEAKEHYSIYVNELSHLK